MIILKGKYGEAKVFTDNVEETAMSQIINLLNQPFVEGSQIRIMSDVHAGAGCVIGFTANITDKVIPNLVGVDIGCGMLVIDITGLHIRLDHIDDYIHNEIPAGHNNNDAELTTFKTYETMLCYENLRNSGEFGKAIGSLGGGNHFIEINETDHGKHYLVIHSGSRNLGKQVAEYYQKEAINFWKNGGLDYQEQRRLIIEGLRSIQKGYEIPDALEAYEKQYRAASPLYPPALCFLTNDKKDAYLNDMQICQAYASVNRYTMAKRILHFMGVDILSHNTFETIHNYVNFKDGIMRKGAVSARKDEMLIIPMNMRDGSLLCIGKGNADWNYSAPHGAGRLMSRSEAKRNITMDEYRGTMNDVFTSSLTEATLDEAPQAYKPMEEIIANIEPTVEILEQIKPIYNFKAGE
jgi:RNA-splicing ligase RtcB